MNENLLSRFISAKERISFLPMETSLPDKFSDYFDAESERLLTCCRVCDLVLMGEIAYLEEEELAGICASLFAAYDIKNYETSFANPAYAVARLGDKAGRIISFMCSECESAIAAAYQGDLETLTGFMELFLDVLDCFCGENPEEAAKEAIYSYFYDNCETFSEKQVREMVCPGGRVSDIALLSDPCDTKTIYLYGRPTGKNEIEISGFLAAMPQETIQAMADTYTEGYRIGFEVTGKDLSKKETAQMHFCIGFERVACAAAENFRKMGLETTVSLQPVSAFFSKNGGQRNVYCTHQNPQYDFDHREDKALYYDESFAEHRLECLTHAFEMYKNEARVHAGPAVQEVFGEDAFLPASKPEALRLSPEQQKIAVREQGELAKIIYSFIPGDERSFTIISYPIPAIGKDFEEIFYETIKLNALDYKKYRDMQQKIIDAMDGSDYVQINGRGDNETNLRVKITKLSDPASETAFENCVADVNIPVGEVFTTPVLEGTKGKLHVSGVYLNGLFFKNLKMTFEDGIVSDYTCENFEDEEENKKYIKDNILMHHETLPMGEFAIGTNTTAYACGIKYGISGRLPILIAEKTGPHFAVGDTCYSREEEVRTYNPDGKEIIAKENTFSRKRNEAPAEAYFGCHTDITIPFAELGSISAIKPGGESVDIIRDGEFVLPGTEELNIPLKEIANA